jgi:CDP-glycerol glycerophosphotransferase (TagB/SpsB family)
MISDFSGVIFDYSLVFDRPVIYADTSFDKSPYDAAWLDEPLWTFRILPSLGIPLKKEDFRI